jgi:hypothetical protein
MPKRSSKAAKKTKQRVTGQLPSERAPREPKKNPAAVALGRLGGLKGGKARAAKLSARKRAEIAKRAAKARWKRALSKARSGAARVGPAGVV